MSTRLFVLAAFLSTAFTAWSQCAPPSTPGVRICTPTANALTEYAPAIEVNSTPRSSSIARFIIYVDGQDVYEGATGQTGITLYDGAIRNGTHNLVVNAWDSDGELFQAKETFSITGQGYPLFCPAPSSPGVNFCVPPASDPFQPTNISVSATATGKKTITAICIYLDGKVQVTVSGQDYISTGVSTTAGKHNITVVAWDAEGNVYTAGKNITAYYSDFQCSPKGNQCTTGIEALTPQDEDYVANTFPLQASVRDNPDPITAMKVYIDNTQVAESNGPTINQEINNAPDGTHILTIQAWDTSGNLYKIAYNVNINVSH